MATREDVFEAIRDRWVEEVQTPQALDVAHDNAPTDEPNASRHEFEVVVDGEDVIHSMGSTRRIRIRGRANVRLRVGKEKGDKALLDLSKLITTAFDHVTLTDPIVQFGRPALVGKLTHTGGVASRVLAIPFTADVIG